MTIKIFNPTVTINDEHTKDTTLNVVDFKSLLSSNGGFFAIMKDNTKYEITHNTFEELSSNPDIFRTHNDHG